MAGVRLIAALAVAACSSADAQAPAAVPVTSGLKAPAGWSALPELVEPAREATASGGITVEGAEAWGEPARGCYALWIALRGEGAAAAQIVAGIQAQTIATNDVVVPEGTDGLVSLTFTKSPYQGRVRARVAAGRIVGLACFANEREPALCETQCTELLGGLP